MRGGVRNLNLEPPFPFQFSNLGGRSFWEEICSGFGRGG